MTHILFLKLKEICSFLFVQTKVVVRLSQLPFVEDDVSGEDNTSLKIICIIIITTKDPHLLIKDQT